MSVQLNSFILPDGIIKKMKDKIIDTQQRMREQGFSLCRTKNSSILKIGNECEGTRCDIERPAQMCIGKEDDYQGLYHTHPGGRIGPSLGDLFGMYQDGLGCVGSPKGDTIKCLVRKDQSVNIKTLERILYARGPLIDVHDKLPKEDFNRLYEAITNHFINENFNVTDVK